MAKAVVRAPGPWNKGKLVGQKAPFKLKEIWAIRVRLQLFRRARDLALFNLGIDSKLRACDLVRLKVRDAWASAVGAARSNPAAKDSKNARSIISHPLRKCEEFPRRNSYFPSFLAVVTGLYQLLECHCAFDRAIDGGKPRLFVPNCRLSCIHAQSDRLRRVL
jgi:hypothetical protein